MQQQKNTENQILAYMRFISFSIDTYSLGYIIRIFDCQTKFFGCIPSVG